ncbi:MAG: bifunctional 4-hydroxy-3-methylbut-2-enyl diphosphate reductase/30S ribosomal protein S1 [Negativicutes bacterium]|jgi:4-hydroxy-3-methylbut-2-enyl diphosphate reductase
MKIVKAEHMGFCYGVKRAVDMALKAANDYKTKKICTLGELIHNKQVVERLNLSEVSVCDTVDETQCGVLIIRSHGVGPEVYIDAEKKGLIVVDATCPDVTKVQHEALALAEEGRTVVIVGDGDHPEVQSIMKWAGERPVVVNSVDEAEKINGLTKIGIVAQTTFISKDFDDIVLAISAKAKDVVVKKTTCLATSKRQSSAVGVALQVDIMIVIGGKHSSNTCHLAKICSQSCLNTFHIEEANELKQEWFYKKNTVGITAGASTPDWIIEGVVNRVEEFSMQDSMEMSVKRVRTGDVIKGVVVSVRMDSVFVDIGYKGEGVIIPSELAFPTPDDCRKIVNRGDEIEVLVLATDGKDGISLSKVQADQLTAWDKVTEASERGEILNASCVEAVKGGVIASCLGLRAFIPVSQLDTKFVDDIASYIGNHIHVKVIEVDREKKRVVLSRRVVLQAEKDAEINRFYDELKEGEIIDGTVARIADFGVFVKLGPVDGLVPNRELSWIRVKHAGELVNAGDPIRVIVQKIDKAQGRISLSVKDLQLDPWYEDVKKFNEEEIVNIKVLRVQKAGIIVEVAQHLEGFVPASELDCEIKRSSLESIYKTGSMLIAKIVRIDEQAKRVILSVKRVAEDAERAEIDKFAAKKDTETTDNLGSKFSGLFEKLKLKE